MNSLIKKILAAALSMTVTVQTMTPVIGRERNANAAETNNISGTKDTEMNVFSAVGIDTKDLSNPDDKVSNPYGKTAMALGTTADEVYIGTMGENGGVIIGNGASDVGSHYTLNDRKNSDYQKVAGEKCKKAIIFGKSGLYDERMVKINTEEFISDICVGCCNAVFKDKKALAQKAVESHQYKLINHDLNGGAGGGYVYMGYKTTDDPNKAISDIIIIDYTKVGDKKPPKYFSFEGRTYQRAHAYGNECEEGDVNYGDLNYMAVTGSRDLYAYYTTDKMYYTYYDENGDIQEDRSKYYAISSINFDDNQRTFRDGGIRSLELNNNGNLTTISYKSIDLNLGAGGDYIYMKVSRDFITNACIEGTELENTSELQKDKQYVSKTAGGNFDGNTQGQKLQYAMLSFDGSDLLLSVTDTRNPSGSTGQIKLGGLSLPGSDAKSYSVKQLEAIAKMNIVTGDFDGNGYDEIAVYVPAAEDHPKVQIYRKKIPAGADNQDSCAPDNADSWELKFTEITVNAANDFITLSAGDVNADGVDDLVLADGSNVRIFNGSHNIAQALKTSTVLCTGTSLSAVVFREQFKGYEKNMIGIMGCLDKQDTLRVMMFAGQENNQDVFTLLNKTEVSFVDTSEYDSFCPFQRELFYANHAFASPYLESDYLFNDGVLEESGKDASFLTPKLSDPKPYSTLVVPFDFQTAVLNYSDNPVQTVFYQYLFLEKPNEPNCAKYMIGAYSPNAGDEAIVMNPLSYDMSSKPYCYAVLNTDHDTGYMKYTGNRQLVYTNPSILAVISAPPCFRDLLGRNDLSENSYDSSETSFGQATSSGSAKTMGGTLYAGVFVKYNNEVTLPTGQKVAQFEAEIEASENYTWSDVSGQSREFAVEFSNDPTTDQVVFYSVPYECYEYEVYFENDSKPVTRTVCIPRQVCISQLSLDEYTEIARSHPELPQLKSDVVKHTVGLPDTYPRFSSGFPDSVESVFPFNNVPYGGSGNSQYITITDTRQHIESSSVSLVTKAGAGVGGWMGGVAVGAGFEWEKEEEKSDSVTYNGKIGGMPKEAQERGYGMNWKLFAYKQSYTDTYGEKIEFPVVDYLVSDVTHPPLLPVDFRQDYINSTHNSIKLDWEYNDPSAIQAFNVYRVSSINGQDNSKTLISTIDAHSGIPNADGTYSYSVTDFGQYQDGDGLFPDTEYTYYIQSVNTKMLDPISIHSEYLKAYTHADIDAPEITLTNITDGKLTIYPDRSYSVQAMVTKTDASSNIMYSDIAYQWQKKDSNRHWIDLTDETSDTLSVTDPAANLTGEYRCRIAMNAYDQTAKKQCHLTVFTDVFTLTFAHRPVQIDTFTVLANGNQPNAEMKLSPSDANCFTAPIGSVVFTISGMCVSYEDTFYPVGVPYEKSYTVPLKSDGRTASASLASVENLETLSDGIYEISAHYAGSSWFDSQTGDTQKILIGDELTLTTFFNGTQRTNTFACGDKIDVRFFRYQKDESDNVIETELAPKEMQISIGKLDDSGNMEYYPLDDLLPGQYRVYAMNMISGLVTNAKPEPSPLPVPLTILPRQIDIGVHVPEMMQGNINELPTLCDEKNALIHENDLAELAELTFKESMNSSRSVSEEKLRKALPGMYYADLKAKNTDTAKKYNIRLHPTAFEIKPVSYQLQMTVDTADQTGDAIMGSITYYIDENTKHTKITNEAAAFSEQQTVHLTAIATPGYQFDHWILSTNSNKIKEESIVVTMPAGDVTATAYFIIRPGKINLIENGGTVRKPEGFSSQKEYPVNTPLTFTAEDKDGVVFIGWVLVINGKAQDIQTKNVTLYVSEDQVDLYALFSESAVTMPVTETTSSESTTSTSTSKSVATAITTSTSESITTSTSTSKSGATSSEVTTGTTTSVSTASPTVNTSGTTVSAETTTSAVTTETTTFTEPASVTTETTSAVPERIPGDVNGDGIVNLKDVTLIRRFIAGGWNVKVNETAADVNGDHTVNLKDVTLIRRYIAGGWNVTLK